MNRIQSSTILRSLQYYRRSAVSIFSVFMLQILSTALTLLSPWPLKLIVDGVLSQSGDKDLDMASRLIDSWLAWLSPTMQIYLLAFLMLIIGIASNSIGYFSGRLSIDTGLHAVQRFREDVYQALQYLPLKYHDSVKSSDSTYRVAYDTQTIQTLYSSVILPAISAVLTLAGSLIIMLKLNIPLSLVSIVVVLPVFWCIKYYTRSIGEYSKTRSESESELLGTAQEVLSSIRYVKAHSKERSEVARFIKASETNRNSVFLLSKAQLKSGIAVSVVMTAGTSALYLVGSLQVLAATMTLGSVLVFANYLAQLYRPVQSLSGIAGTLARANAGLQRSFRILDQYAVHEDEEPMALPEIKVSRGKIIMKNIHFGYANNENVLKGISFSVEPGELVAVVGHTGSGKSTLLSLLSGFYNPRIGYITIDGQDISGLSKSSLRSSLSMVLQETIIFTGTVLENMLYSNSSASEGEVIEALHQADAASFISSLPQGIHTIIGEGGWRLSGGQKQRLAIARAFLRKAPILLLDEPTSSLDTLTEAKILSSLLHLAKGKSTVLVTHRLALADCASKVAVIDSGMLVEMGKPAELMRKKGYFYNLHMAMANP